MGIKDVLIDFALPIITLAFGWLGSAYRNKQKKGADILDNVQRILDIQDKQIEKQSKFIQGYEKKMSALERKYAHSRSAVRKAYKCPHPNADCPVLRHDATWDDNLCNYDCAQCEYNKTPQLAIPENCDKQSNHNRYD